MKHNWKKLSDKEKNSLEIYNSKWDYYRCKNCKHFKAVSLCGFDNQYFKTYSKSFICEEIKKCSELIMEDVIG